MWETEGKFSQYMRSRLAKAGFDAVRLETGGTAQGVPDMFVQGQGYDVFIETKNMPDKCVGPDRKLKVPWRDDQLLWAYEYRQRHMVRRDGCVEQKVTLSFIGMKDGVAVVEHHGEISDKYIKTGDGRSWFFPMSVFSSLDLAAFLKYASAWYVLPADIDGDVGKMLLLARNFIELMLPSGADLDWDPEVYFNECAEYSPMKFKRWLWWHMMSYMENEGTAAGQKIIKN